VGGDIGRARQLYPTIYQSKVGCPIGIASCLTMQLGKPTNIVR